ASNGRCFASLPSHLPIAATSNHNNTHSHDDSGSITSDGKYNFGYDASAMMTSLTGADRNERYLYTAGDERVAVVRNIGSGRRTTWSIRALDNHLLRSWTDDTTTGTRQFTWSEDEIWRGSTLLASDSPTGLKRYHLDHLGSPRLVTNGAGVRIGEQTFDPFGTGGTLDGGRLQFTGHERDIPASGNGLVLDYMHARYYDGAGGRFLSVDPIMAVDAMRSPQLWNRYAYVGNSPMDRTDPSGKKLQFTGNAEDLDKVKQIANSGLHGYKLNIDDKGVASLQKVRVKGKETSEQKALRVALQTVIGDTKTTSVVADSGAKGVAIGQFSIKTIDPTDMQKFGSAQPSAASTLGHEVMEQFAAQVKGITDVVAAHAWAIEQENLFTGWTRGAQTRTRWYPNGLAFTDVTYTRGNTTMDVRVTVDPQTYDVTYVTRTVRP
ncbi:MAG TPA: RHS repeat-associated core domain-containing protein, partial [Thermoanaerobaculia bacterium]